MKKDDIKNSCDLFLYKAISDLNTSKFLLKAMDNGEIDADFEITYFHLQQCAEKLLKSILSKYKIRVLKTHDIGDLIDLMRSNDIELIENISILENLSQYAVEGRYAIIHDDIDDAHQYIKLLDELLGFVQNLIREEK